MSDFVIVGDSKGYKGCLVYVCGTKERAEKTLHRMLNNPDENDKRVMKNMSNFRIEEVEEQDCWWRGNLD